MMMIVELFIVGVLRSHHAPIAAPVRFNFEQFEKYVLKAKKVYKEVGQSPAHSRLLTVVEGLA